MGVFVQIWTLVSKTLRIVVLRHPVATIVRALIFPLLLMAFLSFSRNFLVPKARYGISDAAPVLNFGDSLKAATPRTRLVFVNSGHSAGSIDKVIDDLATVAEAHGKEVIRLNSAETLSTVCKTSLRGVSRCYGAVIFHSSPDEGPGNIWNYTIRADGALGIQIDTTNHKNDPQIYTIPFQRAIDTVIATAEHSRGSRPMPPADEYAFTTLTQEEREAQIRRNFQNTIQKYVAAAFIIGLIGVVYQMTGFIATEREIGMSQLIEAMMATRFSFVPQAVRLVSYHLAFSLLYLPAHILGAFIVSRGIFTNSNPAIVIVYFVLAGFSLTSFSILGAAFFKKSQLSGITVTLIVLLLAILCQRIPSPSPTLIGVLSLLFIPCNIVFFFVWLSRFQAVDRGADLGHKAPSDPHGLTGGLFCVLVVIQIFIYPLLGALVERLLYMPANKGRKVLTGATAAEVCGDDAVRLVEFNKVYKPNLLAGLVGRRPVHAVKGINFSAHRGQIVALLGANGSGKSTTLDAIAGTNTVSSGEIIIDGRGGVGIAPQKNVLWNDLTVEEHIYIFNRLKSSSKQATPAEIRSLIDSVDLGPKRGAMSKTLSGGQKRKLQLGMMLTGGSTVCCVDEVSSGVDPLSRRKIWDILLRERGRRTMIITTHFLDEADLLADYMVVLSKGFLRAAGSSVELKEKLGGGYRIRIAGVSESAMPEVAGVAKESAFDTITYVAPTSTLAAQVIKALELRGISTYRFSGPTVEDVFLRLAEELREDDNTSANNIERQGELHSSHAISSDKVVKAAAGSSQSLQLASGRSIGLARQVMVLFLKRLVVLKSNWPVYLLAFLIPIIAARLTGQFVLNEGPTDCIPAARSFGGRTSSLSLIFPALQLVAGPRNSVTPQDFARLLLPVFSGKKWSDGTSPQLDALTAAITSRTHFVDTYDDFLAYMRQNRKTISPGGLWFGDNHVKPTMSWQAATRIFPPTFTQNIFNMVLTNTSISSQVGYFDIPFAINTSDSLQLLVYFCLAMAVVSGFFALYPNVERRNLVRGLHYSNGVRSLPLWLAYIIFDSIILVTSIGIVTAIWAANSNIWYHIAYMFPVLMLYSVASILFAYIVSMFCKSQLGAYAVTTGGQVIAFLIYFTTYLCIFTYSPVHAIDRNLLIAHYTISLTAPLTSLFRALLVTLNIFSTACQDDKLNPNPASMAAYGAPIVYLVCQILIYFAFIVLHDSGTLTSWFQRAGRSRTPKPAAQGTHSTDGVKTEPSSVLSEKGEGDGLRVEHLTKRFGKNTAVDDVSFNVRRGEVFALLGPNGAGKSTAISLIRGDIQPSWSRPRGDVFVEDVSVVRRRADARAFLGVCPQFDAIDNMTVVEHLRFYARARGVTNVEHNVTAVIKAVGLSAFQTRKAGKLSGGNKRKLSLGIALMGNPKVVLLDEPSSGLDAAAKRIMWRTLAAVVPGRSILLTTHSMEEADALASRAGIVARSMLALGSAEALRLRWGRLLYVHIVCVGAPRTDPAAIEAIYAWVRARFGSAAEIDEQAWGGQVRFTVPVDAVTGSDGVRGSSNVVPAPGAGFNTNATSSSTTLLSADAMHPHHDDLGATTTASGLTSAVGRLVVMLDEAKSQLAIQHLSVSPPTLDQVFLNIVGQHNVQEENSGAPNLKAPWWRWWR